MEIVEERVRIPVSGGRMLSARLWRPASGRHPAIIDQSPYRPGDIFRPFADGQLPYFAAQGYAALAIEISGSGNSPGILRDEYEPQEIGDLIEAIAWVAQQDWCDGGVGLSGFSWSAFAALRAAAHKPPALKAMVLGGVSEDGWRTDIHYLGGALYTGQIDWAGVMLMFNSLPPDPDQFDGDWRAEWKTRLNANCPFIIRWLEHPTHDAYWKDRAAPLDGDTPLLLYAGLADKYATSVLRIASAWRGSVRTIIGPWEHIAPNLAGRHPRIGFLQEAVRWFDQHLKGHDTGILDEPPPLRLWLTAPDAKGQMTDGQWVASDWPVHSGSTLDLALRDNKLVPSDAGQTITLATDAAHPATVPSDLYEDVQAPADLTGAFQSEPLGADVLIGAAPILRCKTTAKHGTIVARLFDVAPDGTAIGMTTAACNLALREGEGEIAIPFQAAAWRVKKGHRLALTLCANGGPTFWPSRNGDAIAVSDVRLRIPLASTLDGTPTFEKPVSASAAAPQALEWIDPAKETLPPPPAGAASHSGISAAHHLAATGTDYYISSRFDLTPLPDNEARAAKSYRVAFERPGWSIRIDTQLTVTSTPDTFEIVWRIAASANGKSFHHVEDRTTVARSTV